ncbi:SMAD/FHA domain-containing protein, partial [Phycomyces blakesleeanus]
QLPTLHVRIVPSIENPNRCMIFDIVDRVLEAGTIIKLGRFAERAMAENHLSFKSKVVSRSHCEIRMEHDGKLYVRDTRSSSGTFLNHVRLSPANQESKNTEIKDGDIVQLGVDYQGGLDEIYRSVKMRFEVNHTQNQTNSYSVSAFTNLRNFTSPPRHMCSKSVEVEECCICLYAIAPFQALFVAPCAHSYHYKCIRPLLKSYPGFQCPICRTYSDLEASVAIEAEEVIEKYHTRSPMAISP